MEVPFNLPLPIKENWRHTLTLFLITPQKDKWLLCLARVCFLGCGQDHCVFKVSTLVYHPFPSFPLSGSMLLACWLSEACRCHVNTAHCWISMVFKYLAHSGHPVHLSEWMNGWLGLSHIHSCCENRRNIRESEEVWGQEILAVQKKKGAQHYVYY